MLKQTILVDSPLGIHLRPATAMCDQAIKYKSKISFNYGDGKTANAKSVISILASSVKCGQEIVLEADGEDEEEAIKEEFLFKKEIEGLRQKIVE